MILPTKHLRPDRALLGVGADVLRLLDRPKTVSALWAELTELRQQAASAPVPYDWFILSLDLLFAIGTIEMRHGSILRSQT